MTQRTREPAAAGLALACNDVDKRVPVAAPTKEVTSGATFAAVLSDVLPPGRPV